MNVSPRIYAVFFSSFCIYIKHISQGDPDYTSMRFLSYTEHHYYKPDHSRGLVCQKNLINITFSTLCNINKVAGSDLK